MNIWIAQQMNNKLTTVSLGDFTVWFSYETPVAFDHPSTGRVVRENIWSNTTGKHLNAIDFGDKSSRVSTEEFTSKLEEITKGITHHRR